MNQTAPFSIQLINEAATAKLAQHLAQQIQAGDIVFLTGELGAGKTTFTRYFAQALGVTGRIKSPTYTLVESYDLPHGNVLHHFDLYRLSDPREWFSAGFDEYLNQQSIALIEWPSQANGALPEPTLTLAFEHVVVPDAVDLESFDGVRKVTFNTIEPRFLKQNPAITL